MRVSVVIPALNEAARLPDLLGALAVQSAQPLEVIVADAESKDDTRAVVTAAGCIVVDGGMPAVGRNAGAAVATGDLLLFLDADVRPEPDFLELATAEFARLRQQLPEIGDPFERLSGHAWEFFDDLVERHDTGVMRVRELLDASDIAVLDRYLRSRLHAFRTGDWWRDDKQS